MNEFLSWLASKRLSGWYFLTLENIFYYKDTQDEVYLKNALENIDSKFIVNLDINQITI